MQAWWRAVSLLLLATVAGAQPIIPQPTGYEQWTELLIPVARPPVGKQLVYVKAGVGLCTINNAGTEFCPGAGGTFLPLAGGTMTGELVLAAVGAAISGGGLVDCDTEAQVLGWDATNERFVCTADAGAGGGMTSFTVTGDTGTMTVTDGETLKISGGTDLTCTAATGSPELMTCDADATLARDNESPAAGDVTGSLTAGYTVTDNSHAHDSSTISGIDISADTNLAVTAPVVLTGDTLSLGTIDISANTNLAVSAPITLTGDTIGMTSPLPVANGGTNLTTATDDNVMVGNGTTWQSKAVPDSDGAGQILRYDTGTNVFSAPSLSDADIPNNITVDLATAATALAADPSDCLSPNYARGINASGTAQCAAIIDSEVPNALTLDLETSTLTNLANDEMLMGSGLAAGTYIPMPVTGTNGCSGTTDKLLYNTATNTWTCGTDATGAGGGIATIEWNNASVTTSATVIDFTDADAVGLVTGATGEGDIALNQYVLIAGRSGSQQVSGGSGTSGNLILASNFTDGDGFTQVLGFETDFLLGSGSTSLAHETRWYEASANGSNFTGWKNPANTAGSQQYIWPNDTAADGEVLTWHTGGQTSWDAAGSISGLSCAAGGDCTVGNNTDANIVWQYDGSVVDTLLQASASNVSLSQAKDSALFVWVVENPSTVGASGVQGSLVSNGTGDAFQTFGVTTQSWSAGVDNSDSDAFAISVGAALGSPNNVLRCSTGGVCSFPIGFDVPNSGIQGIADNELIIGTAANTATYTTVPNCTNDTTEKLLYDGATNTFECRTDQTGGGGGDAISVNGAAATDANFLDADILWTLNTVPAPDTVSGYIRGAVRASPTVCAGTSDASATVETEIAAATLAGKAYFLPSGCVIGLGSPGAGAAAVDLTTGATILCEDQTAGFRAQRQRCTGGLYAGAGCNTDAECTPLGGGAAGTCDNDFGTASANPCTGTECFAPTGGSTYTMLKDPALSTGITIENCTFFVGQADAYQRCVGGTGGGDPCRQECNAGLVGNRCDADADCGGGGGSCLRNEDCTDGGGTCNGTPRSLIGAGKVNPLDLARTTNATIKNIRVVDHYAGDFTANLDGSATVLDSDLAAESTNCTSPFTTPSTSFCFGILAGACCHGAHQFSFAADGNNTQPTTAVTNGLVIDTSSSPDSSVVARVRTRGSTNALQAGSSASIRADQVTVVPVREAGPGTAGAGITLISGTVSDAKITLLASNATGITMSGAGNLTNNTISGLAGTTAEAILVTGDDVTVMGNTLDFAANVGIDSTGARTIINENHLTGTTGVSIRLSATAAGKAGYRVIGNTSQLVPGTFTTPTVAPRHVALEGTSATQISIAGNSFAGGWRGIDPGTATPGGGLTNVNIANNRFTGMSGAAVALGGAGVQVIGNYINGNATLSPASVCDSTCNTTPGLPCNNDSTCGSCSSAQKCVVDPVLWIGNPNATANGSTAHWAALNNIVYGGQMGSATTAIGQCTTTPLGQLCMVAACATGVCSGTPATCQSGIDLGKRCCTAGSCAVRQPWSLIRATDATHTETVISGNKIFGPQAASTRGIDFAAGASGNPDFTGLQISGNDIYFDAAATGVATMEGIVLPAGTPTITSAQLDGNHFWNIGPNLVNYKGSYGAASFPPANVAMASNQAVTSTSDTDITALVAPVQASTLYRFFCHVLWQSNNVDNGFKIRAVGPGTPTMLEYRVGWCVSTTSCYTSGFSNYNEQHISGNAGTFTPLATSNAANTTYGSVIEGLMKTDTAGNFQVRGAIEQATRTTTYMAGSYCEVTQNPAGS